MKKPSEKQRNDERAESFLKSLGHGKSMIEIEREEEKMRVVCILCGDEKEYKTKNKRRCPYRKTHDWRVKKEAGKNEKV